MTCLFLVVPRCSSLSQSLSGNTLLPKAGESGADAQEYNDPEYRHDQSQRQTAREHQDVNEQNVDDDRSEQGEPERDVAIEQKQNRGNYLEQKDRNEIVGDKERPDELTGDSRRRRRRDEMEEAVQSEDEKDKAKKKTSDDSSDFHVSIICLKHIILTSIYSLSMDNS